jgi:hypothetical protein
MDFMELSSIDNHSCDGTLWIVKKIKTKNYAVYNLISKSDIDL